MMKCTLQAKSLSSVIITVLAIALLEHVTKRNDPQAILQIDILRQW